MKEHIPEAKLCEHCHTMFDRPANIRNPDWAKRRCCSDKCSRELKAIKISAQCVKRGLTVHESAPAAKKYKTTERTLQRQREQNLEGKRKKTETYFAEVTGTDTKKDVNHPLNKAQRVHDLALLKKHDLEFETKIYTPAEIEAIKHQITPIERVKATSKTIAVFADVDHAYQGSRRHESAGSLFNEERGNR